MHDSYMGFTFSVQALRRKAEGARSAIATALGVRAKAFAHQVGNVTRILSDLEVRHLLADEVGLGKTVQALMVINAIRLQHPESRIAVVVPDGLVSQWRDELLARAHETPHLEDASKIHGDRVVHLLWPESMGKALAINPATYDFLIVDEIHRLTAAIRDQIARTANRFAGVLVLSATPGMQDPARHLEMLQILEPQRAMLAAQEALVNREESFDGVLRKLPEALQWEIIEILEAQESEVVDKLLPGEDPAVAAIRWSTHRRILRAQRNAFRDTLPQRNHISIVVEPTESEILRHDAIRNYLAHPDRPERIEIERLAIRASLGSGSLGPRLRELIRAGDDRDNLLKAAQSFTGVDIADSRMDVLCDTLNRVWMQDPGAQVIVVCIDNPTVDHVDRILRARLHEIGPHGQERSLRVGMARRGEARPGDIYAKGDNSTAIQAIECFQRGETDVLIAGDIAGVGVNLQSARVLVFYGLPWAPDLVEQWIGRLDRIGNLAAMAQEGEAPSIDIITITQRGLTNHQVMTALRGLRVFEKPMDLEDTELLYQAHEAVLCAAFEGGLEAVEEIARKLHRENPSDSLRNALPYDSRYASTAFERWREDPPLEPFQIDCTQPLPGHKLRERALEGWMRTMNIAKDYRIVRRDDDFCTFWYRWADSSWSSARNIDRTLTTDVILKRTRDPMDGKSPTHSTAYISRRASITQPPRVQVEWTPPWDGAEPIMLPLQFLDHGGILHEDLVTAWMKAGQDSGPHSVAIQVDADHPMASSPGPGRYLVSVGWIDAGQHLIPEAPECHIGDRTDDEDLQRRSVWAHAADARWIRDVLPAGTWCFAERQDTGTPVFVEEADAWNLFKPLHYLQSATGKRSPAMPNEVQGSWSALPADHELVIAHRDRAARYFQESAATHWAGQIAVLEDAAEIRATLIRDQLGETERLLTSEAQAHLQREGAVDERTARIWKFRAQARQKLSERTEALVQKRLAGLKQAVTMVASPPATIFRTILVTVSVDPI